MGVEKSVADSSNALSKAEQQRVGRGNIIKGDEIHQPREKKAQRGKPKGREV